MATNAIRYEVGFERPLETGKPELPRGPVLLGESVAVRRLRSQIRRIAPHFRMALVQGEAGTGKELVARCLHAASPAEGEFVVVEAARIAEHLLRGEGGIARGLQTPEVELAWEQGGTVYLKGVAGLSFEQQAGLLRFLNEAVGRRKAGTEPMAPRPSRPDARTRVVAASDRDLQRMTATGQFRHELYAILSAVEIRVPALRERVEDIPAIGDWVLQRLGGQVRQRRKLLSAAAVEQLQKARWPGNLSELECVVCQAAALAEGDVVERRHVMMLMEQRIGEPDSVLPATPDRLDEVIQRHVLNVLERCGGNKLRAAELLGISRSTLYRMLGAASM